MASPRKKWAAKGTTPDATPVERPVFMMALADVRKDPRRAADLFMKHFGLSGPDPESAPDDPPLV